MYHWSQEIADVRSTVWLPTGRGEWRSADVERKTRVYWS